MLRFVISSHDYFINNLTKASYYLKTKFNVTDRLKTVTIKYLKEIVNKSYNLHGGAQKVLKIAPFYLIFLLKCHISTLNMCLFMFNQWLKYDRNQLRTFSAQMTFMYLLHGGNCRLTR